MTEQNAPALPLKLNEMLDAYKRRFSARRIQQLETVFTLRSTAQQVDNVLNVWFESTAGSPARFRILVLLWAARERPVPHQEIISSLQVKRATVSALMFALERDGLIQSIGDPQDRRRLLATLSAKGEEVVTKALDMNVSRLDTVLKDMSREDLETFSALLRRVWECFRREVEDAG
jgi:DNA-binding MarR family transcriptional regulator